MTESETRAVSVTDRRQEIEQIIRVEGYVSIEALAKRFRMTPQTIRRDINTLADQGVVRRHHGGAALPSSVENVAYATRQTMLVEGKKAIAQSVAPHIPDGASLFINIGTTTEEVARALIHHQGLQVITNNLNVASIFSQTETCEVIIAGGVVRKRDRGIMGEATLEFIRQFKVDFGIIGISGIDADGTLLDFDYREVQVAKAIIANSRQTYLVADHTKFGRNAMVRLGHVSLIDALFTDEPLSENFREMYAAAEVQVFVAKSDETQGPRRS